MKALALLAILAVPAVSGSIAVTRLEGPVGFIIVLVLTLLMLRESILLCMILMRRWQLFGRDLFLIEEAGRHRWVDAQELKAIPVPCRIRQREFRPDFFDSRRSRH